MSPGDVVLEKQRSGHAGIMHNAEVFLVFAHIPVGVAVADDVVVRPVTHYPPEVVPVCNAVLNHVIGPAVAFSETLVRRQHDASDVHKTHAVADRARNGSAQ